MRCTWILLKIITSNTIYQGKHSSIFMSSSVDCSTHSFLTLSYANTVSIIITEHKSDKSKIWCINNENVLLNKNMDYHGIFARIMLEASELVSERLTLLIKVNIPFFYAFFLSRLKNVVFIWTGFSRHKISLKSFGKGQLAMSYGWSSFSLSSAIETICRLGWALGAWNLPLWMVLWKKIPCGVGVSAQNSWCGLSLPCSHCGAAGSMVGGSQMWIPVGCADARLWRYFFWSFRQLWAICWPFEGFLKLLVRKR